MWYNQPQASYFVCAVISIRAVALEWSRKSFSQKSPTVPKRSPLSIFIDCRTHSDCAQNQKKDRTQSESSKEDPNISSANQNQAQKKLFNFVSQSESRIMSAESSTNPNRVLRQPKALG